MQRHTCDTYVVTPAAEETKERCDHQPEPTPYLTSEKVRGQQHIHVETDELSPCRGFGLVIASLLGFLRSGRYNVCVAGMTLHDSLRWMLLFLWRRLPVDTIRERGVRVLQPAAASRQILCGDGGRRPPLPAIPTAHDPTRIPQGMNHVVCLT